MKKSCIKIGGLMVALSLSFSVVCKGAGTEQGVGVGTEQATCKKGGCQRALNQGQQKVNGPQANPKKDNFMEQQLMYTSGKGGISLAELVKDKKAVLLDFYAVWCGPCMAAMPALQEKARKLRPQGVEVVGIKVDEKDSDKGKEFRREENIHWMTEGEDGVYSKQFNITSIPNVILLGQSGEILFNGSPHDAKLTEALKRLGVSL